MSDPVAAKPGRDPRLDVFRGLSLVMIFINHVPGTIYEHLTTKNFGFSDAAEGFVLMSGIAAGLAYMRYFAGHGPYWAGVARLWRRAWQLYMVHIVTTVMAIGVAAATALWFHDFGMMQQLQIEKLYQKPLGFLIGVPLLGHQLGYANILPLYAVLMIAAPLLIWLALRFPRALLAVSVLLWFVVSLFWWNIPNYPNRYGWFLNPMSWQLLFVLGLLTGIAMKRGQRFVPVRGWLLAVCAGWLLLTLGVTQVQAVSDRFGHGMWLVKEYLHAPWIVTSFDKGFLTLPRLTHALALAYVLSAFPAVRQACGSAVAAPFALLGRHALPVFGMGVVLCYAANGARLVLPPSIWVDTLLIGGGIALFLIFAWSKEAWARAEMAATLR